MDIQRAIIEVLFSKIPLEVIIKKLISQKIYYVNSTNLTVIKNSVMQYLLEVLPQCSEDERNHVYNLLEQSLKNDGTSVFFNLLYSFSKNVLVENGYKPYCRYNQLMRWRMLSHKLEQDLFIASFFAKNDYISGRKRTDFTWEPVIKSDNIRLHNMLLNGIAENHFHLKGSAPHFNLVWISLMNRIVNRDVEYSESKILQNKLNENIYFEDEIQNQTLKDLVSKAAILRIFLFKELLIDEGMNDVEFCSNSLKFDKVLKILNYSSEETQANLGAYNSIIQILKQQFGYKFNIKGYNQVVDYAIRKDSITEDNKNSKLLLYGERKIMYDCFKKLYDTEDNQFKQYEMIFYIYILIKEKLRSELVQVNNRIGFKNFSDYQDRKTTFLKKDPILNNAIYSMAIDATKQEQNILSLEARICHESTANKTDAEIKKIDKIIEEAENTIETFLVQDRYTKFLEKLRSENDRNKSSHNNDKPKEYFYVLHIPKTNDVKSLNAVKRDEQPYISVRNVERRNEAKNLAFQLMGLRERRLYSARRIFGIDACANEIGCRPEVFAHSFRTLKGHTLSKENDLITNRYLGIKSDFLPTLKVTYHVGEDFLDIADGLRAIDEAIKFINISHGERIGHALALGVDVNEWYSFKGYNILLTKQDYIDNIAWLLNKIREYNISINVFEQDELEKDFLKYFKEVYNEQNIDYITYYNSWLLRGDSPELYKTGRFINCRQFRYWDRCALNNNIDADLSIRSNMMTSRLYHLYHFDFQVRKKGLESICKKVSNSYVRIVDLVQKQMQYEIRKLGIGIETNPSSNYLIGSFKRYDKHPLVKLFNLGLEYDSSKITECPQLFVSINTDDQGVFGTYLENEYALMALALEKAKDKDGRNIYNQEMIYDWLNRIREMGIQQSFYRSIE